jgi:hypothetical protein
MEERTVSSNEYVMSIGKMLAAVRVKMAEKLKEIQR